MSCVQMSVQKCIITLNSDVITFLRMQPEGRMPRPNLEQFYRKVERDQKMTSIHSPNDSSSQKKKTFSSTSSESIVLEDN
jgi:hypothetical protein